jgi:beta-glucosidase
MDGIKSRANMAGIKVLDSASSEVADVTIFVAGTLTWESQDRRSLSLDDNADALIAGLAAPRNTKVVVLLEIPGAVVMPWRDSVDGIAALFYGGQETGNAWANVLFGDHSPTGHLPISLPATVADTIEPSPEATIIYSEGLATGYRNKQFKSAFPFGHGLTYTNFSYKDATAEVHYTGFYPAILKSVDVKLHLFNVGQVAAATVPQLYLELPAEAQQPAPMLKGFVKTKVIEAGCHLKVKFQLTLRDLSYWSAGSWKLATSATAHIGASSEDIRLSLPLTFNTNNTFVVV